MENKKKLAITHFIAMVLSLGVVMGAHYVYDIWPNLFTSLLFPVNESVWEHTKLFVLPVLLVYLIVYLIAGKGFDKYIPAAGLSTLHMPFAAVMIYHFYLLISGGKHHDMSGIIVSAVILITTFVFTYRRTTREKPISKKTTIIIYSLVVIYLVLMAVFTYYPPKVSWLEWLFMDHENMCYGIIPG